MSKKARSSQRREDSLSRDRIIDASIEILDSSGEDGLTFRTLSERLATGSGAIYWHIANKSDLLTAACDAVIARTIEALVVGRTPKATIRALALGMFDAIDAHPWVGSALMRAGAVADGARGRTHRPAGLRSWRARRGTVGDGSGRCSATLLASVGRTRPTGSLLGREASTEATSWRRSRLCGRSSIRRSTRSCAA